MNNKIRQFPVLESPEAITTDEAVSHVKPVAKLKKLLLLGCYEYCDEDFVEDVETKIVRVPMKNDPECYLLRQYYYKNHFEVCLVHGNEFYVLHDARVVGMKRYSDNESFYHLQYSKLT